MLISLGASFSMFPHDGVGGWMPRPRKDRVDSAMIAAATPSVAATMIGASAFGRMCLRMIRMSLAPMARAASTNSRARSCRKDARTRRAVVIHERRPSTITITPIVMPLKKTPSRMSTKSRGNANIMSAKRMRTLSIHRP